MELLVDHHVTCLNQWRAVTLLNVFLAIAVDNLADAQELTNAEENQAKEQEEAVRKNIATLVGNDDDVSFANYHLIPGKILL
jgi:hypothetical protein